ncbi:response regulator [Pedobacter heparinus]|uniref:response regulator n=1 Tax=Pedobacter heparinus TaxID=984 RepID=UPI00292E4C2A|nr:response regulator [Pedobacter heparinus]
METIVVQDTDSAILDVLTQALEMEGFEVFPLRECDEDFLTVMDRVRPHVVMLDYKLAGEACIKICRQIKEKYPQVPVLALSCNHNIHNEYDLNGFDGYIKKPFDLDLLYNVLRKHIVKPGS